MNQKLLVPDIGDFEKVEVIEILVKVGDTIKVNDPVVTIESDKSSVEVPSVAEGKVDSINIRIGDKVSKGDLLVTLVDIKSLVEIKKNKEYYKSFVNATKSIFANQIHVVSQLIIDVKKGFEFPAITLKSSINNMRVLDRWKKKLFEKLR